MADALPVPFGPGQIGERAITRVAVGEFGVVALCGLRRGEISGLRWEHVNLTDKPAGDLPARSIRIAENRVAVGKEIETGSPKSRASRRVLPLPDDVVDLLKAARKRQLAERLSFGEGYGGGEYVAVDATGQPYNPAVLTWRWGAMLDTLKIKRVRLRDADAPARRSDRGDRRVVGSRQCRVHAVHLRTQPGRGAAGRREEFRSTCDTS